MDVFATLWEPTGPVEYYWSDTEYSHKTRNREMLKVHGAEIKKLFGYDPWLRWLLTPFIFLQMYLAYRACDMSWPTFLLIAYAVGGTITHSTFLAIHEITHNLCFKTPVYNDAYAIFVNLIVPVPYSMMFKTYHAEHHRYLGWEGIDVDVPTPLEAKIFSNYFGKLFFITFQVFFYAFRPTIIRPIRFEMQHIINYVIQFTFNFLVYQYVGVWPLLYCLTSTVLGTGWHPLAGHFISEHFVFDGNADQETFSYYGWINWLVWNAGYHVEHHDFPNIPWTRIAKLNRIAPEFYIDLQRTKSWPGTLFDFLLDKDVSLCSRVTRERGATRRPILLPTSTKPIQSAAPHIGPCKWDL